jgi:hypothetical protein
MTPVPTTPNVRPGFKSGGSFARMVIANRIPPPRVALRRQASNTQIVMAISGLVGDHGATCRKHAVPAR